jgi:hypothetical protein
MQVALYPIYSLEFSRGTCKMESLLFSAPLFQALLPLLAYTPYKITIVPHGHYLLPSVRVSST